MGDARSGHVLWPRCSIGKKDEETKFSRYPPNLSFIPSRSVATLYPSRDSNSDLREPSDTSPPPYPQGFLESCTFRASPPCVRWPPWPTPSRVPPSRSHPPVSEPGPQISRGPEEQLWDLKKGVPYLSGSVPTVAVSTSNSSYSSSVRWLLPESPRAVVFVQKPPRIELGSLSIPPDSTVPRPLSPI